MYYGEARECFVFAADIAVILLSFLVVVVAATRRRREEQEETKKGMERIIGARECKSWARKIDLDRKFVECL